MRIFATAGKPRCNRSRPTGAGFFRLALLASLFMPAVPCAVAQNLFTNAGFEEGTSPWAGFGGCVLVTTTQSHSGAYAGHCTNRTASWMGIEQSLLGRVSTGATYRISGWVRLGNATNAAVEITVRQVDGRGTQYINLCWLTGRDDRWMLCSGVFRLDVVGELSQLSVYYAGPAPGVDMLLDDAELVDITPWEADANERIEELRKRDVEIAVLYQSLPSSNVVVKVNQLRHHFAFGSAINGNAVTNSAYADFFKSHFEWAVMENESKWTANEWFQGVVTYEDADRIYSFCHSNDITMRGHCIYWEDENNVQGWLKTLGSNDLRQAVTSRMASAVQHFKGKFVHWDVNNEMINHSFYKDRLGNQIWSSMFQAARETDPDCKLFVNEFGVIEDGYYLAACENQVVDLAAQGAPIDAIGVQCHFGTNYDRHAVVARFDNLAQLGLPVWVTEFDSPSTDEVARADNMEDLYRIAFSHSSVEGILMWGFWENSQWRQNCHMVQSNWSLNEAGRRYEQLMAEWTTRTTNTTDDSGCIAFRGFHGTYDVEIAPPSGPAVHRSVEVLPGSGTARFVLETDLNDEDGDGLPDWWESLYFDSSTNGVSSADDDGDGHSNFEEYVAGTSPEDSNSVLRLTQTQPALAGCARISWASVSNRVYKVRAASGLAAGFETVADNIAGTTPATTFSNVSCSSSCAFHHVTVAKP